ncbi:protein kinase [Lentinula detonsa]|uniref:Protein kinase n=1 Tax=Lentinula detonsa TaxID=2804962 RepID=A0A9W8TUT4_9AGAR|nr:protein kinase [Lentinula detonsa]
MDTVYQLHELNDDPHSLVGARCSYKGSDGYTRIILIVRILHCAERDVGHCSIVVEVKCECTALGCDWHEKQLILKVCFPEAGSPIPEKMLIQEAKRVAEHTSELWALNHLPDLIDSITITYDDKNARQRNIKTVEETCEGSIMYITVFEELHPLSELDDLTDFAQVFYDILQIHRWLYKCAGILHRDLSIGNIMFRRIEGKVYGVLNDFDLSSFVHDMGKGPASDFRTGTRPFMSVDLLDPTWKGGHLYRHDLESLFFIMSCLACRYERPGVPAAEPRVFTKWFSGTDEEVHASKTVFYSNRFSGALPIQLYFAGFTDWLDTMYYWLCTAYEGRPQIRRLPKLLPARVQNHQSQNFSSRNTPYDWNTLGGIFTYTDMRQLMSSFQNQPLETRWESGGNPDH